VATRSMRFTAPTILNATPASVGIQNMSKPAKHGSPYENEPLGIFTAGTAYEADA
jgi:hypothetical protein